MRGIRLRWDLGFGFVVIVRVDVGWVRRVEEGGRGRGGAGVGVESVDRMRRRETEGLDGILWFF